MNVWWVHFVLKHGATGWGNVIADTDENARTTIEQHLSHLGATATHVEHVCAIGYRLSTDTLPPGRLRSYHYGQEGIVESKQRNQSA